MNPWNIDADSIDDPNTSLSLIRNAQVDEFVVPSEQGSHFFVVAPKGLGKTLLLKAKSIRYRNERPGYRFIPETQLCEKLAPVSHASSFSREELNSFVELAQWRDLWVMCLMMVILRRVNQPLSSEINSVFGHANNLGDHLTALLGDRPQLHNRITLSATHLAPLIDRIDQPVAFFIDNVDEALDEHVGRRLSDYHHGKTHKNLSEFVWINAQLGLMEAIKLIHQRNSHIKIFSTLRQEAFLRNEQPTALQALAYVTALRYSEKDLRDMFFDNIRRMPSVDLVSPNSASPLAQLLGYTRIEHPFVQTSDGRSVAEDVFSYILRHTFKRPRELMVIGQAIARCSPDDRTPERIREIVNSVSAKLFQQYMNEMVPFWNYAESEAVFAKISRTVLSRHDIEAISLNLSEHGYNHVFCSLYNRGLLGAVVQKGFSGHHHEQRFMPPGEHIFEPIGHLPKAEYYVIHPCLGVELRSKHGDALVVDRENIIGNGLDFALFSAPATRPLHVHFGAGKLGLGLAVPVMSRVSRLCVIQRPSKAWVDALPPKGRHTCVDVETSHDDPVPFSLFDDSVPIAERSKIVDRWRAGENVFLLSSDPQFIELFLREAQSCSTALKSGIDNSDIRKMFRDSLSGRDVNVYAFENDHAAVRNFRLAIGAGTNTGIKVAAAVADRICSDVAFISRGGRLSLRVKTESYAKVVIGPADVYTSNLFEDSKFVTTTASEDEQEYFARRKIWLVNGLHFILGICGVSHLIEKNIEEASWPHQFVNVLMDIPDIGAVARKSGQIQSCRILIEQRDILSKLYPGRPVSDLYLELSNDANTILARFRAHPDSLLRALRGDDAEKVMTSYEDRLREMLSFVKTRWKDVIALGLSDVPREKDAVEVVSEIQARLINVVSFMVRRDGQARR